MESCASFGIKYPLIFTSVDGTIMVAKLWHNYKFPRKPYIISDAIVSWRWPYLVSH